MPQRTAHNKHKTTSAIHTSIPARHEMLKKIEMQKAREYIKIENNDQWFILFLCGWYGSLIGTYKVFFNVAQHDDY